MEKEEFYNLLNSPDLLNLESLPKLKELSERYPYFQTAKVLYLKNLKLTRNSNFNSELKKTAPLVGDRKTLNSFLNPEKLKSPESPGLEFLTEYPGSYFESDESDAPESDNLIDKFLSSKPGAFKIENRLVEELSETSDNQILAGSDEESDELITETLATIYLQQKKYAKAIEAFQKLSLKYPEKSGYFATRIEETEKLKNK